MDAGRCGRDLLDPWPGTDAGGRCWRRLRDNGRLYHDFPVRVLGLGQTDRSRENHHDPRLIAFHCENCFDEY